MVMSFLAGVGVGTVGAAVWDIACHIIDHPRTRVIIARVAPKSRRKAHR